MYSVFSTIKDRLERFLTANTTLAANLTTGDLQIQLTDSFLDFGFEGVNQYYPYFILMDNNTTGTRTATGGYTGAEIVEAKNVDINEGIIKLKTPVTRNLLTSAGAKIYRAPAKQIVKKVVLGDLKVIAAFPTVCVVPGSKSMSWWTLNSTKEDINIEIIAYIERGDTEQGTEDLLILMDAIEWIMMSNLHIKPEVESYSWNVTSTGLVPSIDYGVIQKGNEFLKAARMTWEGVIHVARDYLYGQNNYEGN